MVVCVNIHQILKPTKNCPKQTKFKKRKKKQNKKKNIRDTTQNHVAYFERQDHKHARRAKSQRKRWDFCFVLFFCVEKFCVNSNAINCDWFVSKLNMFLLCFLSVDEHIRDDNNPLFAPFLLEVLQKDIRCLISSSLRFHLLGDFSRFLRESETFPQKFDHTPPQSSARLDL